MSKKCEKCFWYWTDDYGDKQCHNEYIQSMSHIDMNDEDDCVFFDSKFLGNPPSRDVGSDYDNECW